ncbi:signal peptidase I [Planococcus lenghuensis]|uniref:Signal peptidase I n=1 Tax=Planococcus lenghuensis TaxID=2213202 RepID=A0A1Q2KZN0_9BACL|nr:signal peptidase I [Planococcus lenghuensis]
MEESKIDELIAWMKSILFALLVVLICQEFFFTPVIVEGSSMLPTFQDDNRLIIAKTTTIDRFDVIVFHPTGSEELYIKRIIGIPGDHIAVKDGSLFVNGKLQEEPFVNLANENVIAGKATGDFSLEQLTGKMEVPADHFFVLGDNRFDSTDSRIIGFIPEQSVVGEAKLTFFPFPEAGFINR